MLGELSRGERRRRKEEGETTRNATPSDDCEDVMNIHLAETNARTIQDSENARKEIERRWKARERTGERGKKDSGGSEGIKDKADKRKPGPTQSISIPIYFDKTRY